MKIRKTGLAIFLLLFVALLLLNRNEVTFSGQDNFQLKHLSSLGSELNSVIHLNNPNLLSSTIKKIHEGFYYHDTLVGILDNEIDQGIPGRKESEFPVSIRFMSDNGLPGAISDTSSHLLQGWRVEGEIEYQNLIGGGKIKINQSVGI